MMKSRFENIETEIRKEKAEVLGMAGERLEAALQEIARFRRDLLRLTAPALNIAVEVQGSPEIREKLAQYARLCEHARHLRYCLIVQREALGLRAHGDVDRQYPMPAPVVLPGPIDGGVRP